MKRLPVFLFSLFLSVLAIAQDNIHFIRMDSDTGLPDNSIRALFQDSDGMLWMCTREGICMFDGNRFKVLESPDCEVLGGLSLALLEDTEHRLWFVTSKGIGYYNLQSGETRTMFRKLDGSMMAARIARDRAGRIWFATGTLYCWNPDKGELVSFAGKVPFTCETVQSDQNGRVWCLSREGHLYRQGTTGAEDRFDLIWEAPAPPFNSVLDLVSDNKGHMLFSAIGGVVMQADILTGKVTPLYKTGAEQVRSIVLQQDGSCWVGTENGIILLENGKNHRLTHVEADPTSLPGDDVWVMYQDRQEDIWVGMFYNGLCMHQKAGPIQRFSGRTSGGVLSGNMVRALAANGDTELYVGSEDGGLDLMDLSTGKVRDLTFTSPGGSRVNVQSVLLDGNALWVATFGDGVFRMDARTGTIFQHYLEGVQAVVLYKSSEGDILLGTSDGLYRFYPAQDNFRKDPVVEHGFVHTIYEDSQNWFWVGTYGSGLWIAKDNRMQRITTRESEFGLTSDYITFIGGDSRGRVWVCTEGGGAFYLNVNDAHSEDFRFRNISRKNGLTSNVICAIVEDSAQLLWLSTSHGIVKLDCASLGIREVFITDKGGVRNQYAYGSALMTSSGRLFFGTNSGLFAFPPSAGPNMVTTPVYITDIVERRSAESVSVTEKGKSALQSRKIKVRYAGLSSLNIYFSSPSFGSSHSVLYETTLLRRRNQPVRNYSTRGEVSYAALLPGTYTFQVRTVGPAMAPVRRLTIEIVPPFYRAWWAYVLYVLLAFGFIWLLLRQYNHIRQIRTARREEMLETRMQKELYDAKINFFTHITHEIRTPLTLIKMPLDKMVASGNLPEENREDILTMQANAERLLNLTNQLLDIRKMEKNEIRPTFLRQDLAAQVRTSCKWFKGVCEDQHVRLEQSIPEEPVVVDFDADMVEKILSNLLSNALKYGEKHVQVKLEQVPEKDLVRVRVNSNGPRVPEQDREQIFEMFYQSFQEDPIRQAKGTGLGLPFARRLARLHKGNLYLDPQVKDFNSFVLELPVRQEVPIALPEEKAAEKQEVEGPAAPADSGRHIVLVVEDDLNLRAYIARELSESYNILVASNGEDALETVRKQRVDLIVSDIMMPGMDGCTLCNQIKSTQEFSHIPVILLTAAVGMETRIETLEAGADGYIEKPFSIKLLEATIANLFKNRDIANHQFVHSPLSHFNSIVTGNADQEFMDRLHALVMEHLSEADLNIETLTTELGTSKSTLYRKVTANTGLNINEYVRVCRLKKAAELLSTQQYRISEVAYQTGFSSPSYFTTCFQKQFNVAPSAFLKGLK